MALRERKRVKIFKLLPVCLALAAAALLAPSCGGGAGSSSKSSTGFNHTGGYTTPWGMTLNESGSRLYVANNMSRFISIYDTSSMKELKKIPVACKPRYLAFNGDYSRLYVTHDTMSNCQYSQLSYDLLNGAYISVIDLALEKVVSEIAVPGTIYVENARDIVYDPEHNVMYILGGKTVAVFNPDNNKFIGKISGMTGSDPARLRYDKLNKILYIVHYSPTDTTGDSGYTIDILIPDDPTTLSFSRAGYNAQSSGLCIGNDMKTNCSCSGSTPTAANSSCHSDTCFGYNEGEDFPIPYCSQAPCSRFATDTTEVNCVTTDVSATSCSESTTTIGGDCRGVTVSNACYKLITSEISCTTDTVCQDGYSCNLLRKSCNTPRACNDDCRIGFTCVGGFCVTTSGTQCDPLAGNPDTACKKIHKCDSSTKLCRTTCTSNYECEGDDYYCDTTTLPSYCKKRDYSDSYCQEDGFTCNEATGFCEKPAYLDSLCEDGFTCNTSNGKCEKTTTTYTECAEENYTCNQDSGKCETSYPDSSKCDTASGYSCTPKSDEPDEDEFSCSRKSYYNGCSCGVAGNCIGTDVGCSGSAGCFTYTKLKLDNIGGFCDRESDPRLCYSAGDAYQIWKPLLDLEKCTHPADLLILPDGTAYVTCYGNTSGDYENNKDSILRLMWDEDGLARNGDVIATRDSFAQCNKPTKMALSPDGTVAFILCFGERKLFVIEVATGDIIDEFFTPQNPIDVITSSQYVFVTGSTTNDIARFAIPKAVNTNVQRRQPARPLAESFIHAPLNMP